jgi:hypothetical protein
MDDGIPDGLDDPGPDDGGGDRDKAGVSPLGQAPDSWRVMAGGNAVVVQCATLIGLALIDAIREREA